MGLPESSPLFRISESSASIAPTSLETDIVAFAVARAFANLVGIPEIGRRQQQADQISSGMYSLRCLNAPAGQATVISLASRLNDRSESAGCLRSQRANW